MKSIISLGVLTIALSFCNITDKLTGKTGSPANSTTPTANTNSGKSTDYSAPGATVEKPKLSNEQLAIADSGELLKWEDQGMVWTLPKGWKKMTQSKEMLNYGSPDMAFLIANISPMSDSFPIEASITAYYDSAVQQIKNGKYEFARYLEIDGVKGVEFVETMPEDKSGPRRHQWVAYRNFNGQVQMLNVMLSTKGSNFEKQKDIFPAVLYTMKIAK